ncbi:hypothetical protein E2562_018207 [Oryza meyeriana var. granulata]|uniref:Uncharacterized protein n=1 Tax=Oryza meyeriana var. granulata TaxID=110450 RepID=A0A6G1C7C8_9ORYZ|nr:hypothetical protein E2562_018207 [Oryza meyeriana var. granulata]
MALRSPSSTPRRDLGPRDSPPADSPPPTSQGGSSNGAKADVGRKTKEELSLQRNNSDIVKMKGRGGRYRTLCTLRHVRSISDGKTEEVGHQEQQVDEAFGFTCSGLKGMIGLATGPSHKEAFLYP